MISVSIRSMISPKVSRRLEPTSIESRDVSRALSLCAQAYSCICPTNNSSIHDLGVPYFRFAMRCITPWLSSVTMWRFHLAIMTQKHWLLFYGSCTINTIGHPRAWMKTDCIRLQFYVISMTSDGRWKPGWIYG